MLQSGKRSSLDLDLMMFHAETRLVMKGHERIFLNFKAVFRLTEKIGKWNLNSGLDINQTVLIPTKDSGEMIL